MSKSKHTNGAGAEIAGRIGEPANADLIAAAPELLAALKSACASIEVHAATTRHMAEVRDRTANIGLADELDRLVQYYRAAIARAEGF